ncbi:MAG: hypothetical protein SVW57_03850, partial [Thermodesulfobacteriota bacterium]|nr:hypothetical protein [Thermodesulfobacteriota bacterium]
MRAKGKSYTLPHTRNKEVQQRTDQKSYDHDDLRKLIRLINAIGLNSLKNIDIIVQSTGEMLGGMATVYHRLDEESGLLSVYSSHNLPQDFITTNNGKGCICYEEAIKGKGTVVAFDALEDTKYTETDPNITR